MEVTIIYDNEAYDKGLKADWGFACLVETDGGHRILFDTGANGDILLNNMEKLDIDPASIDEAFISHAHFDHTGGLSAFLGKNDKVKSYLPVSMSGISIPGNATFIDEAAELHDGVYSSGELSGTEQSMVCRIDKGLVVIVGCSHPGVNTILDAASQWGKPYALIGGLHGFREFELLRGLELVCACHCTQHRAGIEKFCQKQYNSGGAGRRLQL
ncbi:MAG: MBL fold metallo-hydrolase [Chloroflexota bacterium]|nr:MBL fold metallo-hydrolase [Chloroflexota bacterium]